MAVVTNEILLATLKQLEQDLGVLNWKMQDINGQLRALVLHSDGMRQDIHNISRLVVRQDMQLGRIERRHEITQVPK